MNDGLIPLRYAKALYMVAKEKKQNSEMYGLMKTIESAFASQPELQQALANPYISDADKQSLLSVAAGISMQDNSLFNDFLKLLAQNRRLYMAREISSAYIKLYRESNDIYPVSITSASALSQSEQERLQDLIVKHLNGGKMELSTGVDPSLIGGFTVSIGNQRLDASVSNELKQLRLNLIRK